MAGERDILVLRSALVIENVPLQMKCCIRTEVKALELKAVRKYVPIVNQPSALTMISL